MPDRRGSCSSSSSVTRSTKIFVALVVVASALSVIACGNDYGAEPSSTPPSPLHDGGTTTPIADGGGGDDDAASKADAAGDAFSPNAGCKARLCTNFDTSESAVVPFGWDSYGYAATSAPSFTLSTIKPFSPPNALRLAVDVGGGASAALFLEKQLGKVATLSLGLRLRVDTHSGNDKPARIVELTCDKASVVRLKVSPAGDLQIDDPMGSTSVALLAPSTWHSITLDVTSTGSKVVLDNAPGALSTQSCATSNLVIRLGNIIDDALGAQGIYDFSFDDITLDWQ